MASTINESAFCAVCGRTILAGETTRAFIADGEPVEVCALCVERAERAGWRAAGEHADIETVADTPEPRSRHRPIAERFGGRGRNRDRGEHRNGESSAEGVLREALEAFNRSHSPRTVSSVSRSLGLPMVSVRPRGGEGGVLVTCAWDLSWYQWEVEGGGIEARVREVARGEDLAELGDSTREWNGRANEQGKLALDA